MVADSSVCRRAEVHRDGALLMQGRIIFDRKMHPAAFQKCDAFNGNRTSEKQQHDGAGASACRESGTYVPPKTRHVASLSIDGFGAPF
jgi:hypothetical protein